MQTQNIWASLQITPTSCGTALRLRPDMFSTPEALACFSIAAVLPDSPLSPPLAAGLRNPLRGSCPPRTLPPKDIPILPQTWPWCAFASGYSCTTFGWEILDGLIIHTLSGRIRLQRIAMWCDLSDSAIVSVLLRWESYSSVLRPRPHSTS